MAPRRALFVFFFVFIFIAAPPSRAQLNLAINPSTGNINYSVDFPTGLTLTIESGGALTAASGSSVTIGGTLVLHGDTITNDATFRSAIGLIIGTDVQAYDADLTTYAGITPSANVQSLLAAADYAAMRTALGLVIGTNVQAYDAQLADLSGLSYGGNALKVLRVNAGETALELATGGGGGGDVTQAGDNDFTGTNTFGLENGESLTVTYTGDDGGNGIVFNATDVPAGAPAISLQLSGVEKVRLTTDGGIEGTAMILYGGGPGLSALSIQDGGAATFYEPAASGVNTVKVYAPALTDDRAILWPNASGTLALKEQHPRVLDREFSTLDVTNTNDETTIFSHEVPANTIGTTGLLRCQLAAIYTNAAATRTVTIRVKFGATTLYEDTISLGSNATVRPFEFAISVANLGATNSQAASIFISRGAGGSAPANGLGDMADGQTYSLAGTASEDTTAAKTFAVTVQLQSGDNSAINFSRKFGILELVP